MCNGALYAVETSLTRGVVSFNFGAMSRRIYKIQTHGKERKTSETSRAFYFLFRFGFPRTVNTFVSGWKGEKRGGAGYMTCNGLPPPFARIHWWHARPFSRFSSMNIDSIHRMRTV